MINNGIQFLKEAIKSRQDKRKIRNNYKEIFLNSRKNNLIEYSETKIDLLEIFISLCDKKVTIKHI